MDDKIKELIDVSRDYGKNKSFVIAGGGNTSYKNEEFIWVKASGSSLETIDENGFVCLSRAKLKPISTKNYSQQSAEREAEVKQDLANAIVSTNGNRPSVETSMHEVIEYPFVVHTHPTNVNALMCSKNAAAASKELFGDDALFIPYTDPGYVLFKKVATEIKHYIDKFGKSPQIIFLENHGVFVAADSVTEINDLYEHILQNINACIEKALPSDDALRFESPLLDQIQTLHPSFTNFLAKGISSNLIHHFVKDASSFEKVKTSFTPDDIVYCKAHYLFIPEQKEPLELIQVAKISIANYLEVNGYLPKIIAVQGVGIIAVEDSIKTILNMLEVYTNILKISFLSENFGGPQSMTAEQIDFIDNWEVENYRRQMAK